MPEKIEQILSGNLPAGSNIAIQFSGNDALDLLKLFYNKGRQDALLESNNDNSQKFVNDTVTRDVAMSLLGVSSATLWHWNKTGYLKNIKKGRRVLYRRSDIESVLGGRA